MPSNIFGNNFKIMTFGESRSKALGVVIDGVKPNITFDLEFLKSELAKRKPQISEFSTTRNETDEPIVLSGVFNGKTLGTPICIVFFNKEQSEKDYENLKDIFRPGHADFTWFHKYKIRDHRGGGRSSGRETISRVAAGAIAKKFLSSKDIHIEGYTIQIGNIKAEKQDLTFAKSNNLRFCDPNLFNKIKVNLNKIKENGDSTGTIVEIKIKGVPVGLGDPVFEKLDANLAKAVLSIGGVKGIEFGAGFKSVSMLGSKHNDPILSDGFASNNAGGILGGISTGEDIILRCAIKPVSSILKTQQTIDITGNKTNIKIQGKHDVILVPRIIPVIESMCALVIVDALENQNNIQDIPPDLNELRYFIDQIDNEILDLLAKRMKISKKIGKIKQKINMKIENLKREEQLFRNLKILSEEKSLNTNFIKKLYNLIVEESKQIQTNKNE